MAHIGNLVKKAIANHGFNQTHVADRLEKGKNTIQRWLSSPNLGLKEVREIQEAFPEINLQDVYLALEELLGHEIPDNPYAKGKSTNAERSDSGIRIMIDAEQYAGYRIPKDFVDRVRSVLEDAQDEDYGGPPVKK